MIRRHRSVAWPGRGADTVTPPGWLGTASRALVCLLLTFANAPLARGAWRTFSARDGLPAHDVYGILEDRNENLWFATSGGGVARTDGVNWRIFTTADGLSHNDVRAMLQDRAGSMWFATWGGGVCRYDGALWQSFPSGGSGTEFARFILEDRAGNLWFATSGGVRRYDGSWRTFTTADGLGDNVVFSILEDRAGALWFGTNNGVTRYDGTWQTLRTADGLAHNLVYSVVEDRAGLLWFGTGGGGVNRYDPATGAWTTFTTADGLASNSARYLLEARNGDIWVGHSESQVFGGDGVSRYDGSRWETFTTADGLGNNVVRFIQQDRAGNLWFGTFGSGVSRYDDADWRAFTIADGLASDAVSCSVQDRSGAYWFGTFNAGASRYDGATWTTFTQPASARAVLEDRAGNLWFATYGGGAKRFDGVTWQSFTTANGLVNNFALSLCEDHAGNVWVGTNGGVSRYDGQSWTSLTVANGLANPVVQGIVEDRTQNLWFATYGSVSRYTPATSAWTRYTRADGLPCDSLLSAFEDRAGDLWFGTGTIGVFHVGAGITRFDGTRWRNYSTPEGVAAIDVRPIVQDRVGHLWFGTTLGASHFDGTTWRTVSGMPNNVVPAMLEDERGALWFSTGIGVNRYRPDRVPPWTLLRSAPPRLSPSSNQVAAFEAFGESDRIEFSHRLDGRGWSPWASAQSWAENALPDGVHTFEVRARDDMFNIDSTAAVATFEIDATPPVPVIAAPGFGEAVRGTVVIQGTAADARFARYGVVARLAGTSGWTPLIESTTPVVDGPLATWNTTALPDGSYEIRLAVSDTLELTANDQVTVRVDNHAPYDEQTAPARVYAATGGDIYTMSGELHLYFPPHAFAADAQVTIEAAAPEAVPETLPSGATRVLAGHFVDWRGSTLEKPMRLELSVAGVDPAARGALALHYSEDGTQWRRLGGTLEDDRILLATSAAGYYALYDGGAAPGDGRGLSALSFTPRVFSPTGGFADRTVGIAFELGRSGAVTVRVYNRAGRLMREVVAGETMAPGANLVRWDGRDRDGGVVEDGLYLVTVEALGETRKQPLAVVR